MNKLITSILLSAVMLTALPVTDLPVTAFADTTSSISDKNASLSKLGFNLSDSNFNKNQLHTGLHKVKETSEILVTNSKDGKSYDLLCKNGAIKDTLWPPTDDWGTEHNCENSSFTRSTVMDTDGDGRDECLVKIYLQNSASGGKIKIMTSQQYDAYESETGETQPTETNYFDTTGEIVTSDGIENWGVNGLLSMSTGDFDGDGLDEIAVYTPNNNNSTESTSAPFTPNSQTITIYGLSVANNKYIPFEKQKITIASIDDPGTTEWLYSANGSKKQFYSIPYVEINTGDVNNDGIDDLLYTVNFQRNFRGMYKKTYTKQEALNPNSTFCSVLNVYEGGKTLKQTVKNKVLFFINGNNSYAIVNASAKVGNFTSAGSHDILIAGNTINSTSDKIGRTVSLVGGGSSGRPFNFLGISTYENLKSMGTTSTGNAYNWKVSDNTYDKIKYYTTENSSSEPVALVSYASKGKSNPDTVIVEGEIFEYSGGSISSLGTVRGEQSSVTSSYEDPSISGQTNVWVGDSLGADSIDSDELETAYMTVYTKKKGKNIYTSYIYSILTAIARETGNYLYQTHYAEYSSLKYPKTLNGPMHVSLAKTDIYNNSVYIDYDAGDVDVYYSEPEILSILQAPPHYKELNALNSNYGDSCSTSFSKTKGSSSEQSNSRKLTAGIVAGFETEANFFGLFSTGIETEACITSSVGLEEGYSKSIDYTSGYNTSSDTDSVVLFTVPYVRYNCKIYLPKSIVPSRPTSLYEEVSMLEEKIKAFNETGLNQYIDSGEFLYRNITTSNIEYVCKRLNAKKLYIAHYEKIAADHNPGDILNEAGWYDYHYCIPQTPITLSVDAKKYDEIADSFGLDKIYGNVFNKNYVTSDPSTYATDESMLHSTTPVYSFVSTDSETSTGGFETSSHKGSGNTSASQEISITSEKSQTQTFGSAVEGTVKLKAGGISAGITGSIEKESSATWTTTEGNSYQATIANLPDGSEAGYDYSWKLASFTKLINGKNVPVVGYITKVLDEVPPSVAENLRISSVDGHSIGVEWNQGVRKAKNFTLICNIVTSNGKMETSRKTINADNKDQLSCVFNNLDPSTTYGISVISNGYGNGNTSSIESDSIDILTLPEDYNINVEIKGINSNELYPINFTKNMKIVTTTNHADLPKLYINWQKKSEDGWEDVDCTNNTYSHTFTLDSNNSTYRACVKFIYNNTMYTVYSNEVTANCISDNTAYKAYWDDNSETVTVSFDKPNFNSEIYALAYDENGRFLEIKPAVFKNSEPSATVDIGEFLDNGDSIKIIVLERNTIKPLGKFYNINN